MNPTTRIALALLVAGAVFMALRAVTTALIRRRMSRTERAQSALQESARRRSKGKLTDRIVWWAGSRGYTGSAGPLVLGFTVMYIVVSSALVLFGVAGVPGLVIALPITAVVVNGVAGKAAANRKAAFDRQLLEALTMLADQIESGGIQSGLDHVARNIGNPLRTELVRTLDTAKASRDLVTPMRALSRKYPSKAFELFVAALEIDQDLGGRIEPALRQAAQTMRREFELVAEARAEVSQARMEFWGILAITGFILVVLFTAGGESSRDSLLSPIGVTVLTVCAINTAAGVWRGLGYLNRASGQPRMKYREVPTKAEDQQWN